MRKICIYIFVLITAVFNAQQNVVTPHVSPALRFTENLGQWDENVLFRASLDGGALFLERNALTFNFYDKKKYRSLHLNFNKRIEEKDLFFKGHVYKMHFVNANPNPSIEKMQEGSDYENFYLDNDPKRWKSGVRNYHQVWLKGLYNKIDYEVMTSTNGIKYNFHVRPGGVPSQIKIKYEGIDDIKLKDGALIIKLEVNEVVEQKPYAYQLIDGFVKQIACKYVLKNKTLSFEFPSGYNTKYDLIIDPVLVFSAQIGVTADNFGMTATYDVAGNLYSGGTVFNPNYAVTPGAYSSTFIGPVGYGRTDLFITKYNSTGNALLYSTYLGGSGTEIVTSLVVDFNNNLCLYGATSSPNFPMTPGAAYNFFKGGPDIAYVSNGTFFCGGTDIYLAKFNPSGTSLLASTYYGGTQNDGINHLTNTSIVTISASNNACTTSIPTSNYDSLQMNYGDQFRGEIQVDLFNNIYIVSSTRSTNLPIIGGFDNSLNGAQDALVAKFNSSLSSLIYASFIGGSHNDAGNGIYVNQNQEVFVTGGTCSNNLLGTSGGYLPSYQGGKSDGFIYKISNAGNSILNATYIGTTDYDNSFFIQGDRYGKIYIYGQSYGNMPIIKAVTSPTVFNVPNTHQFITRFDNNLSSINMSTVFGSKTIGHDISPSAFAVDKCNNIYVSGWGSSLFSSSPMSGMPLASPTQSTTTGWDFYLMGLDSNANNLIYGSYHGGGTSQEHVDGGTSRFDPRGVIYQSVCAGCGGNDDFPRTPFTWPCPSQASGNCPNQNPSINCNNGVFKINFQLLLAVSTINTNTISGCNPLTVNFTNGTPPTGLGASSIWYFGNGQIINTSASTVAVTYTTPGTYTVSLVVIDPTACNEKDSSVTYITVHPNVNVSGTATQVPCSDTVLYNGPAITSGILSSYQWSFSPGGSISTSSVTSPVNTYSNSGTYTAQVLAVTDKGCRDSAIVSINVNTIVPTVNSDTICQGASGGLLAGGGTSYSWQPSTGLSNTTVANPAANPTVTTTYSATITNTITGCVKTLTTQVVVNPKPVANFNYTINPCGGGVQFADQSVSGITQWNWSLGNSQYSSVQNPYMFYPTGGNYSVTLVAGNIFNCYDTIVKSITVGVPPPVSVSASQTICLGGYTTLNATGGFAYQWQPTVGLSNPNFSSPIATPTTSTQYSVTISALNSVGDTCRFVLATSVNVTQVSTIPIAASANPDTVIKGNSSVLTLTASPGATAMWLPQGTTSPVYGYTVNTTPNHTTTYTVVITRGPCTETVVVKVVVIDDGCESSDVFVPNTFTPNGDGYNDVMFARGHKLDQIYFAIYNRWGELVFETNDKNVGWDGTYKGKPADVGVFGYYIKVKCYNGLETFKKGNITLIR